MGGWVGECLGEACVGRRVHVDTCESEERAAWVQGRRTGSCVLLACKRTRRAWGERPSWQPYFGFSKSTQLPVVSGGALASWGLEIPDAAVIVLVNYQDASNKRRFFFSTL